MGNDELLAAIFKIRTNPAYQSAEALRRKYKAGGTSAVAMATATDDSAKGAILLLIGAWETIALMLKDVKDMELFYEKLPICHMWNELDTAIKYFRTVDAGYAQHFGALFEEHEKWLEKKNAKDQTAYRTANCNFGLQAFFG